MELYYKLRSLLEASITYNNKAHTLTYPILLELTTLHKLLHFETIVLAGLPIG